MKIQLDEGYQFGLGAFETIAIEHGIPILLEEHLDRLIRALEFFSIDEDVFQLLLADEKNNQSTDSLKELLRKRIKSYLDTMEEKDMQALKLMVSKENILFTHRPNPYTKDRYAKGFTADFSRIRRNETSPLVYHKTLGYGECILEKRHALSIGLDEMIFLNTRGEICEGSTTNIFFVKEGTLFTPEINSGLLPGIMREYLLKTQTVTSCRILPAQLDQYEECFVTNSLMGIMPVKRLGDHVFTERKTADRLLREYEDYCKLHNNVLS